MVFFFFIDSKIVVGFHFIRIKYVVTLTELCKLILKSKVFLLLKNKSDEITFFH